MLLSEKGKVEEGSTMERVSLDDTNSVVEDSGADAGSPDVVSENEEGTAVG
jgi:hypothetical protein